MNTNNTKLAIAITTALMLSGCGDELSKSPSSEQKQIDEVVIQQPDVDVLQDDMASPLTPSTDVEGEDSAVDVPNAYLTFVANLPAVSEVNAAFIADSHFIDIDVYSVPFASYEEYKEALAECDMLMDTDSDCIEMTWVSGGVVDNLNPELQFGFIPGNYLVHATPYHQKSNGDVINQGGIIAFSELSSGEHSIPLYALEANWTFETPVDLVLLNQADPFNAESDQVVDANPLTDEVESFAEMLLLDNDSPLETLHLPSISRALQFSSTVSDLTNPIIEQTSELDANSEFVPILSQIVDGNVTPIEYSNYVMGEMDSKDGLSFQLLQRSMSSASVAFSYANGVVTQDLALGSYHYNVVDSVEGSIMSANAGLFFVTDWADFLGDETDVTGQTERSNASTWPDTLDDLESFKHMYSAIEVNEFDETTEVDDALYITNYMSFRQVFQDLDGLLSAIDNDTFVTTQIETGARITGSLIEFTSQSILSGMSPAAPADALALIPSHDDIVTLLGFSLMEQALSTDTVSAANARSDTCFDLSSQSQVLESAINVAFIDDEWRAGSVNDSYAVVFNSETNRHEIQGSDLNGDGEINYFETDVFANQTCEFDSETLVNVCMDLDGDGVGNEYETLATTTQTEIDLEVCVHPITLVASSLEMPQADLEVVISSEK